jgi:aspartate kinase
LCKIKIGGILQNDHLARISVTSMPGQRDAEAALFSALGRAEINVQFIAQCAGCNQADVVVLCVDRDDVERALGVIKQSGAQGRSYSFDSDVASVGIFGPDFRVRAGIAGALFAALAAAGIAIQAASTSVSTATAIIPARQAQAAVAAILQTFELP